MIQRDDVFKQETNYSNNSHTLTKTGMAIRGYCFCKTVSAFTKLESIGFFFFHHEKKSLRAVSGSPHPPAVGLYCTAYHHARRQH